MDLRQVLAAAKSAQRAGELNKAEEHYREAAAAAPGVAGIHFNLALVLTALSRREEAVKSYREAVGRRPNYSRALGNLGNLLCDLGRFREAASILRQVIAIDPDSTAAATLLIALCKLVEAEPTNAAARVDFAAALGAFGRLDEAEAMYQSALAIDNDSVVARRGLAGTAFAVAHRLQTQGELAKAIDEYRKALEFRPDFVEAHNNLGNALREQGKLDEAIGVYRRALEIQPDLVEAHHNLAIAYQEQGNLDRAHAALRKAIQLSTAAEIIRPALRKRLTPLPEERPAVMVVSHERSGTHFLMNSLAACYGYVSAPPIDLDHHDININYYSPITIRTTLSDLATRPVANIVKSHHAVEFFADELPRITERYVVFYIHRDPVRVMLSFWRFIQQFEWLEGPKVADACTFALAEPCGHMMRYQVRQFPNLIARWAAHVDGWLAAARGQPRVVPVRYEELDTRFEETVAGFADVLRQKAVAMVRPARDTNVIAGGPKDPRGPGMPPDTDALRVACQQWAGTVVAQLGY